MRFEFATANRIVFGPGTLREVGALATEMMQDQPGDRRVLVVLGGTPARAQPLLDTLLGQGFQVETFPVSGEPTIDVAQQGTQRAREAHCSLIVGYGGGSVLDAGKAIAALLTNGDDLLDYLEVIGRGQPLTRPSAPYIAMPTTAGTGAEVTRNAVLGSPAERVKVSLRSPLMLPRLAVVDPELTYSLPPQVTANAGLDALTQLIEPYVSYRANPLTDVLCREGLLRAARSLQRAYQHSEDAAAREDMSLASLFSGLALANAALGAVHGFAGPIGGMFPAPHGAICARLLPFVMAATIRALAQRQPGSVTLHRYDEIGQIVTGNPQASAWDAVAWVQELCGTLHIPPLATYGVTTSDFPALVEKAAVANSMKGHPIPLTQTELLGILEQAG